MTRSSALAALALLAVMTLGLWQVAAALRDPAIREIPASAADIREGRTTAQLEREVEKRLPWREGMATAASAMRYLLGRGGGSEVVVGRDGWLFLADELRYQVDANHVIAERVDTLAEASRRLEKRGIALVVALVPDKTRVYARELPQGAIPAYNEDRYAQSLASLRARGVATVDLLSPLAAAASTREVYYRTDTHWNAEGARITAQAIAAMVKRKGAELPAAQFREAVGAETERPGDLIRLMGLEHAPRALRPAGDVERPVTTEEVPGAAASDALFGEASVAVVLLGTSYSRRANFHGFLQQALATKVLDASKDGAGFGQSAAAYFANDAFRDAPPKVIVWEIPERVLPVKDDAGAKPPLSLLQ